MLIDSTHIRWGLISAGILVVATASYIVYATNAIPGPSGGSVVGLLYGVVASLMMIFAGLLAVRARFPTARLGSAQFWLRGHLWLGALSFVFALFHCGFRFGSTLETALLITFIVVIATGVYGLVLQQFLPRLIFHLVPLETFGQQVPFLCRRLQAESDVIVAKVCGKLECDYETISDAAYNLADSMGILRNGKEGQDFQKFVDGTYANGSAAKASMSKVVRTEVAADSQTRATPTAQSAKKPADKPVSESAQADNPSSNNDDSPAAESKPNRPMSKLEMVRAAAAKKEAAPADPPSSDETRRPQPTKESVKRKTAAAAKPAESPNAAQTTMTTEVLSVRCPNCSRELALPDRSFLGRFARCPQCAHKFVLALADEENDREPPTESTPPNPQSRLEQARTAAAATANRDPEQGEEKLSPLARMKAAAAKKTASEPSTPAKKAPGRPKGKPLPKKQVAAANEPIPRAELLKGFYLTNVRPFLAYERSRMVLVRRLVTTKMFAQARYNLPPQLHGVLGQLQSFCDERRQFTVQQQLHRTLHSWLMVHIPASIALFVLLIVHVVVALRVIPWTR